MTCRGHAGELPPGVQAQVGGHLVVAAPAGVQLGPDVAGELGDPPLDGGVDVLVAGREGEDRPTASSSSTLVERGQQRRPTSPSSRIPARPRPRTWAREPARSSAASRRSKGRLAVKAITSSAVPPETAVPQGHDGRPTSGPRRRGPPWRADQVATPRPHSRTKPSASACAKVSAAS